MEMMLRWHLVGLMMIQYHHFLILLIEASPMDERALCDIRNRTDQVEVVVWQLSSAVVVF